MGSRTDRHASVASAVATVLAAERDALAQIAACESRAEEIMREARRAVRELRRRAQSRISTLHASCEARNRELVRELELEAAREQKESPAGGDGHERLRRAVERVARDLTGQDDPDAR